MPSCHIAPSILSFDLTRISDSVETMASAGAQIVHLDVMDGQFVPPITFGDAYVKALRPASSGLFEAHLMIQTPEAQFVAFAAAGCGRIIFHDEATVHSHRLIQSLKELGVEAGIAINPGTSVESIRPVLDIVDLVLVMTVNPGWAGQKFIKPCLEKVAASRLGLGLLRRARQAAPLRHNARPIPSGEQSGSRLPLHRIETRLRLECGGLPPLSPALPFAKRLWVNSFGIHEKAYPAAVVGDESALLCVR